MRGILGQYVISIPKDQLSIAWWENWTPIR